MLLLLVFFMIVQYRTKILSMGYVVVCVCLLATRPSSNLSLFLSHNWYGGTTPPKIIRIILMTLWPYQSLCSELQSDWQGGICKKLSFTRIFKAQLKSLYINNIHDLQQNILFSMLQLKMLSHPGDLFHHSAENKACVCPRSKVRFTTLWAFLLPVSS